MDVASALGLTIPETIADSAAIVVSGGRVEEV